MHLANATIGESGRRASQVYEERYPVRIIPQNQIFACVHRSLCEQDLQASNMHVTGRRRLMWIANIEEQVLQSIENKPNTSTRAITQ
ncbi:hypothetical protein TNIN_407071 [Trichonephila inaurata madagascariensis]|uniref:Uncharacterized protein n=1 Tax=Trichonephila inaurata madagascariensis TaxID=2747483 RepID=A0A8X6YVT7_9ARAC|nr:hypothetical protein TNIN_407071 [Trichonephila inaurata madagascariensis]